MAELLDRLLSWAARLERASKLGMARSRTGYETAAGAMSRSSVSCTGWRRRLVELGVAYPRASLRMAVSSAFEPPPTTWTDAVRCCLVGERREACAAFSVGVAFLAAGEQKGLEDLLKRADAAMYEEKRRRKVARGSCRARSTRPRTPTCTLTTQRIRRPAAV